MLICLSVSSFIVCFLLNIDRNFEKLKIDFSSISKINFPFYIYKDVEVYYQEDYLLELEIPCINLRQFVYDIDSDKNHVDYHVEILESSDIENNVYFFAGHSGNGSNNYFNDLDKLQIGDLIYIRNGKKEYCYVVESSYFIFKNGYLEVDDNLFNVLFLITCSLEYPEKQLVIKAKLV